MIQDSDGVLAALGNDAINDDPDGELLRTIRERFNQATEFESVNRQ